MYKIKNVKQNLKVKIHILYSWFFMFFFSEYIRLVSLTKCGMINGNKSGIYQQINIVIVCEEMSFYFLLITVS